MFGKHDMQFRTRVKDLLSLKLHNWSEFLPCVLKITDILNLLWRVKMVFVTKLRLEKSVSIAEYI